MSIPDFLKCFFKFFGVYEIDNAFRSSFLQSAQHQENFNLLVAVDHVRVELRCVIMGSGGQSVTMDGMTRMHKLCVCNLDMGVKVRHINALLICVSKIFYILLNYVMWFHFGKLHTYVYIHRCC